MTGWKVRASYEGDDEPVRAQLVGSIRDDRIVEVPAARGGRRPAVLERPIANLAQQDVGSPPEAVRDADRDLR